METNKNIQRDSIGIKIKPTNSMDCCLLFHPSKNECKPRWNPKVEDLMAIDWEVVC